MYEPFLEVILLQRPPPERSHFRHFGRALAGRPVPGIFPGALNPNIRILLGVFNVFPRNGNDFYGFCLHRELNLGPLV